jgi:hypothetical protein
MRRPVAALAAVALLAALAACTADPPAGTDGDLMDDWAQLPSPAPFRPVTGECHEAVTATVSIADRAPVSCADLHVAETFHVGAAAEAPVPPAAGSAGARRAYAECGDAAERFLGGPWRAARIGVRVAWPTREAWTGGARWFRCDVVQADLDGGGDTSRTGSLKDALTRPSPLDLGCFDATVSSSQVRTMTPVDCTTKHSAEFAGLWTAPDVEYAEQAKDRTRTAQGCRSAVAEYTGVPDDDDVQYRTGWISYHPTRTEWLYGERRVRCFLWFSGGGLTRSYRGAGPAALPVR